MKRNLLIFTATLIGLLVFSALFYSTPLLGQPIPSKTGTLISVEAEQPSVWGDLVAFSWDDGSGYKLCYYNILTSVVTETGLSGYKTSTYEDLIAYLDGRDLKLYDVAKGVSTDLGVKAIDLYIYGDYVVVATDEQDVGDLNGDGDTSDCVIRIYQISTGLVTNTGADGRLPSIDPDQGIVIFLTDEINVEDFNGDGDFADRFVRIYDMETGETTVFKEAYNPHVQDGYISYFVENGNGDLILHTYDLDTEIETDLEIEGWSVWHCGNIISLHVCEWQIGDINNDGDINERFVMWYNRSDGVLHNTWIEGDEPQVSEGNVIFQGASLYFFQIHAEVMVETELSINALSKVYAGKTVTVKGSLTGTYSPSLVIKGAIPYATVKLVTEWGLELETLTDSKGAFKFQFNAPATAGTYWMCVVFEGDYYFDSDIVELTLTVAVYRGGYRR